MGEEPRVRQATYTAGGAEVPAWIYESSRVRGGVLLCPGRLRELEGLEFLARELVDRGYMVLAIRYRGMEFYTDDDDALAAFDVLDSQLPRGARMGIVGHSRGGMTALRVAARDPRVRTVVSLAPPTDFTRYVRAMDVLSPLRYAGMVASMGGTPDELPERYRALSAISYAERIQVPVLLVCGTQDLHSPLDHSQWMLERLRAAGNTESRLEVLDGVGHFFERMYSGYVFDEVRALTGSWIDATLGGTDR